MKILNLLEELAPRLPKNLNAFLEHFVVASLFLVKSKIMEQVIKIFSEVKLK